jgi:hypothetical protein
MHPLKGASPRTLLTLGYLTAFAAFIAFAPDASAFGFRRTRAPASHATPTPSAAPVATATPAVSGTPVSGTGSSGTTLATGAPTCTSKDTSHICIGLKLVSYTQNGVAVLSQAQAITLVNGMNIVWAQCNIAFQLEKYEAVDPTSRGLAYDTNWRSVGDTVRSAFNNNDSFLVVSVGSLSGSTIAVTEMPGAGVYGTLVEKAYATNALTVGHEIGHYQGLYHISDNSNLMNPYIGSNTSALNANQCSTARSTDYSHWQSMMRF